MVVFKEGDRFQYQRHISYAYIDSSPPERFEELLLNEDLLQCFVSFVLSSLYRSVWLLCPKCISAYSFHRHIVCIKRINPYTIRCMSVKNRLYVMNRDTLSRKATPSHATAASFHDSFHYQQKPRLTPPPMAVPPPPNFTPPRMTPIHHNPPASPSTNAR